MRLPIADLAGALGTAAGVVATVAVDVVLLAQTEVAEAAEISATRGGSSAMPHKANPVAAISARACARRAPGLVATLFAAMEQEHERAAGAWHSEWPTLTDLLVTVGSAASWLAESLASLRVDTARMAATVAASGEGALAGALAEALNRPWARARRTTPPPTPSSRPGRPAGRWPRCSPAGRTSTSPRSPTAPDVGEAGAQVDAVLADHRPTDRGDRMSAVAVSYTVDGAGGRARRRPLQLPRARPAACGIRRCRRWPSGTAWSPTTPAGTGSRRRRPGRTRSTTWSTTWSRCWTRWVPSGRTSPGSRWAG